MGCNNRRLKVHENVVYFGFFSGNITFACKNNLRLSKPFSNEKKNVKSIIKWWKLFSNGEIYYENGENYYI